MKRSNPNVLFLLSDQHRYSALNCSGNTDVISPNFDRLASEGTRFTNCVSSSPVCAPFRATFQTGLYTHQHQVRANSSPWLGQQFSSLADGFNAMGYETCFIGKSHWGKYLYYDKPWIGGFVPPERRMRWKHWYGMEGHAQYESAVYDHEGNITRDYEGQHQPTIQTDLAMEKISEFDDRPWFLQLNWGPPHTVHGKFEKRGDELLEICREVNRKYGFGLDDALFEEEQKHISLCLLLPQYLICDTIMPQKFLDLYDPEQLKVDPNVHQHFRKMVAHHLKEYYGLVSSLDEELGRLMAFLREMGRDQDTLVFYTSDHGDQIGAHCSVEKFRTKSSWHQNSTRVPLIVWGPALGVAPGGGNATPICSVDFMPTLFELIDAPVGAHLPGESFRECFLGTNRVERERSVLLSLDPWRAIFDGRYMYVIECRASSWQAVSLIDTVADPHDQFNLIGNFEYTEVEHALHEALVADLIRTSDHSFILQTGLRPRHI